MNLNADHFLTGPVGIGFCGALNADPVGLMGLGMPGIATSALPGLSGTGAIGSSSVLGGTFGSVGALGALYTVAAAIVAANSGILNLDLEMHSLIILMKLLLKLPSRVEHL
ncbi:hypothetical protein BGZ95_003857 [Linnemannia exigua]|uniref:Uncharacterized protein n=1 Tax=Linnemannia exigua TaxID=604196 RepID=A0AAD4H255_9FUNG|nr:hypothetical protein BGZ95_003857 [Linnemannia exigua]